MRAWVLRFRKQDKATFDRIKNGEKSVETRALNGPESKKSYYGDIQTGDRIVLLCDGERMDKHVASVRKYSDFEEYLEKEDLEVIMGKGTTKDSARAKHFSFPGYKERLEKYGIVAFEIE